MKKIELILREHKYKQGDICPAIEPNVKEDCLFMEDGKVIGFYIKKAPKKLLELVNLANSEFRSDRVPKSVMSRKAADGKDEETGKYKYRNEVFQYSTIIGSIPEKPHMKRNYKCISSVHQHESAQRFIKSMLLACEESEKLINKYMPEQYAEQMEIFKNVPDDWKFGNMFTSSISNFNIPAAFHIDRGNIKNTVNVIITKRKLSKGGCLYVPDYDACIEQSDGSVLVYPAWKSMHGVTPIEQYTEKSYRNSLIFYPLKAFLEN
jgi:hypothetical protein